MCESGGCCVLGRLTPALSGCSPPWAELFPRTGATAPGEGRVEVHASGERCFQTLPALFHMRSMAALMAGARRSMRLRAHIRDGEASRLWHLLNLPLRKAAARVEVQVALQAHSMTLQRQLAVGAVSTCLRMFVLSAGPLSCSWPMYSNCDSSWMRALQARRVPLGGDCWPGLRT